MRALAIAILLICTLPAYATDFHVELGTELVSADGYGADERSSLSNALKNAVDKVLSVYVPAAVINANRQLIENNILARSVQYVSNYKILSIKREGSAIRTFLDAQIDVFPLILNLMALNITPELDPNSDYARIIANAARIAQVRSHIVNEWPLLFRPASKFMEFTVDDIYFDNEHAANGKVPFVLRFYARPKRDAYNMAAQQLHYDMEYYQVAEEIESGGSYFSDIDGTEGTRGLSQPNYPRTGVFQLALPEGELYTLRNYRVITPFQEDVRALMNNNGGLYGDLSKLHFRIQLKNGAGAVLYEHIFSLFPVKSKISIFLRDESGKQSARWVDNIAVSLKSIGYSPATVYDARPKITPYFYVEADGRLMTLDELLLGYQDSIAIADMQQITTITIEVLP
ncbi:MAG: hypothetical protein LBV04_02385 [Deferribacteraceae bacterium]|jgi:hypothetical protein|nr:hypothetical protein [Deferribacteraceae bacterium]